MTEVLLVHAAATWALVGLIWFVQLVHYPLFAAVGAGTFTSYEAQHTRRTSWVVGLLMPVEAITAVWLAASPPPAVDGSLIAAGLVLVAGLWTSTAIWQAPMHGKLRGGYNAPLQQQLVRSNWLRTVLWTARGMLVFVMVASAMG